MTIQSRPSPETRSIQAPHGTKLGSNGHQRAEKILGMPVLEEPWNCELTITPARAAMLIKAMPPQLPIVRSKLEFFKAVILSGRFRTTHQGLAFNTKGELIDGQHRLAACVDTERAITVRAFFNEPDDNFQAFDRGRTRGIMHDLILDGALDARLALSVQAAARLIWHFDAGRPPWTTGNFLFEAPEVHEALTAHPLLLPTTEYCMGLLSRPPRPPMAPVIAFGTLFREVDNTLALAFIDQVMTGEQLRNRDPALVLRVSLANSGTRKARVPRAAFMGRFVHAWNNVREGRRVRSLTATTKDGGFPEISGYKRPKEPS